MSNFGLTAAGFLPMQQQDIISDLRSALKVAFGNDIDLSDSSNFGQFVGIMSERLADLWQLDEAIYASQSPGGAEGTSVDNLLAYNGLRRNKATPTRTNPSPISQINGIKLYGLLLRGVAGTPIPAGSIVQTQSSPPLQFTLDAAVTINAAQNALQSLFMSNVPDSGAFQLSLNDLLTASMPFNILPHSTLFKFATVPISGVFSLHLVAAGVFLNTPSLNFNANALAIQTAIRTLAGYGAVVVTGTMAGGFTINWGSIPNPVTTFNTNTTTVSATFLDSVQSQINNLFDGVFYPYTDVAVVTGASGFDFQFGMLTPASGQPSSSAQPIPLLIVAANSLQSGFTVTNLSVVSDIDGAPAQVAAIASCTQTGPNFVAANAIDTIGTPISGWTGVINQLDCLTGTNIENDTEALVRRTENLQANANGPLQSIVEKVRALTNVTTAIGFENLNEAALQIITFPIVPVSGKFNLLLNGNITGDIPYNATSLQVQTALQAITGYADTLVTGDVAAGFTIDFNGSQGGQPQNILVVTGNTTGGSIIVAFGRPGKSFEIVVNGGDDTEIANAILGAKPAGIQSYGSTSVLVFDDFGNPYTIAFSRPTQVPIYVSIVLTTDFTSLNAKFNPSSVTAIQGDIVALGNLVSIGGLIIGFGSNGLIGAFNGVPGILNYTLFFDRTPSPVSNANIQMQPEEVPVFETFNVAVSYT